MRPCPFYTGFSTPLKLGTLEELQVDFMPEDITSNEFRTFVENCQRLTEAIRTLDDSTALFLDLKTDSSLTNEKKIEKALLIVDNLQAAEVNTTDDLKLFSKIKLMEGKLFLELLANEELARECFR